MAALLRRLLLKKPPPPPPPPPLRFLASLHKSHFPDPAPPPPLPHHNPVQRSPLLPPLPDVSAGGAPPPSLRSSRQVYPSFPLSFLVDPIDAPLPDGSDDGGDRTAVWLDSVKKKRKRKMNKHKYKKLRKRLRRKTK